MNHPDAVRDSSAELFALFESLGYPCERQEVSSRLLADVDLPLFFACAAGSLDLYVADHASEEEARMFVSRLTAANALRVVALAVAQGGGGFTLFVGSRGSSSRCTFDPGFRQSFDERLRALALPATRYVDPGELFVEVTSRDRATREFFKRFSSSVAMIADSLGERVQGETKEECRRHAILVLSRLLFLYFIQRRGWLNGEARYLLERFREAEREGREFYATVLLPLFFGCLNTPPAERQDSVAPLGLVPYLNGGLFNPARFELANASVSLSNELIREVLSTFEPFTFVVDERDSGGSSIDPEMLGKVFESLMAEDERLRSGTFYTPREVVDTMTEEALIAWIADDAETLLSQVSAENFDAQTALRMLERLRSVRVLDPACGSGAFLLASLYAIEKLTRSLEIAAGVEPEKELRRRIVERSLFGVDLKPEAVRLCELRLWLAIVVVEETDVAALLPLPNLDRNIFQGNTLFSPTDALTLDRRDLYHDWMYALRGRRQLIDSYRHAEPQLKRVLGEAIRKNDRELVIAFANRAIDVYGAEAQSLVAQGAMFGSRAAAVAAEDPRASAARGLLERAQRDEIDFFSCDVHFAHVLAEGGFDVVVGNPPWVRHARLSVEDRRRLSDRYSFFRGDGSGPRQSDLAIAFCERAMNLLATGGVLSFLLPSKVLSAGYAAEMRRRIAAECEIRSLRDYSSDARTLFDADTFPLALTLRRRRSIDAPVLVTTEGRSFSVTQSEVVLSNGTWSTAHPRARAVLNRLRDSFPSLAATLERNPTMGVKTGANRFFLLDDVGFERGRAIVRGKVEVPLDALCRTVRGRDLERWKLRQSSWMLWSPGRHCDASQWVSELAALYAIAPQDLHLSYVRSEHLGIKVAWKDLSRGLRAAVLPAVTNIAGRDFPLIPNQTLYFIDAASLTEAHVLAAILNSSVVGALAVERCDRAKDNHFRYFGRSIAELPMPQLHPRGAEYLELARISRLAHGGGDTAALDDVVARMYGVSSSELEVLREYLNERLA